MCGIFGFLGGVSSDLKLRILRANQIRGSAAFSCMNLGPNKEWLGSFVKNGLMLDFELGLKTGTLLGHFQAPTSQRNADRHPFQWGNWFVAHNGVIHNWKALATDALTTGFDYEPALEQDWPWSTDSSVIPWVCSRPAGPRSNLELLDGTFACWAYNASEKQVYLFSWVNPIHLTKEAFSSCPFEGSEKLEEGVVIKWPTMEQVATFVGKNNPYRL